MCLLLDSACQKSDCVTSKRENSVNKASGSLRRLSPELPSCVFGGLIHQQEVVEKRPLPGFAVHWLYNV